MAHRVGEFDAVVYLLSIRFGLVGERGETIREGHQRERIAISGVHARQSKLGGPILIGGKLVPDLGLSRQSGREVVQGRGRKHIIVIEPDPQSGPALIESAAQRIRKQ